MAESDSISNLTFPSEFIYNKHQLIQAAITNEYDEEVSCSNLSPQGKTLDFEITGEANVYRDLSNSYLQVVCRVVKDTSVLGADDAVAPVNNLLHSLFSDCEISVCGTRVNDKESHYPYRAVIEQLLSSSPDVLKTRAKLHGWELDTNPALMDSIIVEETENAQPNPAFLERRKQIALSKEITLIGRPHADLFHQDLDIPANCRINVKLTRTSNEFVLMAADNAKFKVEILSASLFVRSKEVAPEIIEVHREQLKLENLHIPLTQCSIKTFQIGANLTSASFASIFPDKLPKRIVVGLVRQDRVTGKYSLNPFKFENFDLKSVFVTVGGKSIPAVPLSMNYGNQDYARAYINTLAALNLDTANKGIELNPELWANAYNLYAFKLVPGAIQGSIESTRLRASVNLSFEFSAKTTAPIEVFVYSETGRNLEITATNKAFTV